MSAATSGMAEGGFSDKDTHHGASRKVGANDKNTDQSLTASKLRRRTTSTCETVTVKEVVELVRRDPHATDFVISMFTAAVLSYRRDTLIRPFPSHFISPNDVEPNDFPRLMQCLEKLPSVPDFTRQANSIENDAVILLGWLLRQPGLQFSSRDRAFYDHIQELTGKSSYKVAPDFIFEFKPQHDTKRDKDFEVLKEKHGVLTAYHGSALENFHSILTNGFLNQFNKTALYGEGTYFSSDLSVCMGFCAAGKSWDKSELGPRVTCVAVCDVVKHPDVTLPGGKIKHDFDRASTVGGSKAPPTYVIVPNNDHVRLRYVFVYAEAATTTTSTSTSSRSSARTHPRSCMSLRRFVGRHRFALTMLSYLLMLVCLGLWQNRQFKRWVLRTIRLK
eukprot:m.15237 g.15237  ORF g.15237 m.15237 type:complete len:390 (+) comp10492_c0_seq1:38-1207(+)